MDNDGNNSNFIADEISKVVSDQFQGVEDDVETLVDNIKKVLDIGNENDENEN